MSKSSKSSADSSNLNTPHTKLRSFYREYRPQKFTDVIGQDRVVSVLTKAIENGSIAHAYLFSGSRGTGKTTVARLFAKALNTVDEDIYEIDAASHTQVDHMRELLESISTLPFRSHYKVYILDEVHMLSKSAFNAFLKTLEEPPAHVIFILATTETDKVPETILSRCQHFHFQTPSVDVLEKVVERTAAAEKLTLKPGVASLIALSGDGSFRDTLGALQKAGTVSKDKTITLDEAEMVLGAPRQSLVRDFLTAYIAKDIQKGITVIAQAKDAGVSFTLFAKLITRLARALLHAQFGIQNGALTGMSDEDKTWIEETLKNSKKEGSSTGEISLNILPNLIDLERNVRFAFMEEIPFEVLLMKKL